MTAKLALDEEIRLDEALDERADHIPVNDLRNGTAQADFFDEIHRSLTARGTKLLVGPRGCGKTHMMRYTWLVCRDDQALPLAVYVSFNRYYRLEPLLKTRSNAVDLFHGWVIARILIALGEVASELSTEKVSINNLLGFAPTALQELVDRLERGLPLTADAEQLLSALSVNGLLTAIEGACDYFDRKRAVVLLDDAALTLTPEYLFEFFDVVRVLRTQRVSPKASVYPATDYGPRFHAAHEADEVPVWLSVDRPNYRDLMGAISIRRLPNIKVPAEVDEVLKLAAFGVPRAYLTMLRDFARSTGTQSQVMNRVIESHAEAKREEYRSMAIKMPRFESLIRVGVQLFEGMLRELRDSQSATNEKQEKQLVIGIADSEIAGAALVERLFNLLFEAGLVFQAQTVSHGEGRLYRRYMPHLAALISARAVTGGSRSSAASQLVDALSKRSAKHPLRRTLAKLVDASVLKTLRIDLPACRVCGAQRLTSQQRFCASCGSELLDDSTFARCMSLPLTAVPGLTLWQRDRVAALDRIRTIGDLFAIQDPGSELRKLHRVGNIRAAKIVQMVTAFVDEFLS